MGYFRKKVSLIKGLIMKKLVYQILKKFSINKYRNIIDDDFNLTSEDLFFNPSRRGSALFLGKYTRSQIDYALKRYGIYSDLKKRGFFPVLIHTDFNDPFKQKIVLYIDNLKIDNILAELVVQKKQINLDLLDTFHLSNIYLVIEWLLLQNPFASFPKEKPRLPGQRYPGLGIGKKILTILSVLAQEQNTAGLINVPEHYHNGAMYSRKFYFVSPKMEGLVKKINDQLVKKYGLAYVSWAIERKCVFVNSQLFEWQGSPQIIPVASKLKKYFHSPEYKKKVQHYYNIMDCTIDHGKFQQTLKENPISGFSEFILSQNKPMSN